MKSGLHTAIGICALLAVSSAGCSLPGSRIGQRIGHTYCPPTGLESDPLESGTPARLTRTAVPSKPADELRDSAPPSHAVSRAVLPEAAMPTREHPVVPIGLRVTPADELTRLSHLDDASETGVETAEPSGWSLEELESLALRQNPAILQASASAHKAMGFRRQVGLRPNPVVGYQGMQLADQGTDQHVAFVEQDLVLGDKLRKNERVLNQEIQSQLWEVDTQRMRVITDLRQRYYETLAAQRRIALAAEFEAVAEKGVRFAEARVNAFVGTRPEVLQAEIQLKEVQLQRRQAEATLQGAWTQLMALAGMPHQPVGTLQGDLSLLSTARDWSSIETQILSTSPEVQGARARLARARASYSRQQVQATPNLSLMLAAGQDNATGSGMINTQIGLPLPVHNRNQGNIGAAHAEYCRAAQDLRRTELAIQSRLADARREFETAAASVIQYDQEILPRARQTLRLAEETYAAGESDFLQVLIVRRTYFEAGVQYLTAQVAMARAAALIDGSVLTGGLDSVRDTEFDSDLRDQALSGQ